MSNKLYDILKFASLIVLPFSAMVAAIISAVMSGGDVPSIIISIGEACATFLGILLTVMSKIYWKQEAAKDKEEEAEG